jgi:hypothetical protein
MFKTTVTIIEENGKLTLTVGFDPEGSKSGSKSIGHGAARGLTKATLQAAYVGLLPIKPVSATYVALSGERYVVPSASNDDTAEQSAAIDSRETIAIDLLANGKISEVIYDFDAR